MSITFHIPVQKRHFEVNITNISSFQTQFGSELLCTQNQSQLQLTKTLFGYMLHCLSVMQPCIYFYFFLQLCKVMTISCKSHAPLRSPILAFQASLMRLFHPYISFLMVQIVSKALNLYILVKLTYYCRLQINWQHQ